jgi:hypothetical protein
MTGGLWMIGGAIVAKPGWAATTRPATSMSGLIPEV